MNEGTDQDRGRLLSGRFPELEDALCERVRELRGGGRLDPLAVVVGSAAVRTRLGDLLVRRLGAVANVRVVTLARFAADLVAQGGGAAPDALGGLARERLVRRLVSARQDLGYFAPVAQRPHFAQALAATFADLREACVAPDAPWAEAVAEAATGESGQAKAADLARLYSDYCAGLERRGLTDAAGVQRAAAAIIAAGPGGAGPAPAHVIIYGLYDLNQAQEQLLRALVAAGADVFVPVPRGGTRDMASALAAAVSAGLREKRLQAPPSACNRDAAAAVWAVRGEGDSVDRLRLEQDDPSLAVVSVSDQRAEMREAAREVLAVIEEGGAAAWDCAVVVPHGDNVEHAAAALKGAGLPVACRLPDRSAGPRVLLRLADCLAPQAGGPFARRAVVDLLTAAALREGASEAGDAALWLDEARQAGVVSGLDQWTERLPRHVAGLHQRVASLTARGEAGAGEEDDARHKLAVARSRLDAARALEATVSALAGACAEPPAPAAWGHWAEFFARVVQAVFDPAVADAARDAAARLQALAVLGEEVELVEAALALRDVLAGAGLPHGRVGRDGVAVLTPLELRGLSFHTVVFTGLAAGGFPSRGRPDPLFGDAVRRALAEALGVRLPLAELRDAESTLLFAFCCEAARDRLVLLAPRSDATDGRPRLPSRILLRLASLAAGAPVGVDEFLAGDPLRPVWRRTSGAPRFEGGRVWVDRRERDTAALLAFTAAGRRTAAREYLAGVIGDDAVVARRLGAWRSASSPVLGPWDGLLGEGARRELAARHPFTGELSPTALERYVSCPFAYLLQNVFGMRAPEEPADALEMDAAEFGSLAHAILHDVYARVIEGDLGADEAGEALEHAWGLRCAEAERDGVTGAALAWEVRRAVLLEDLRESLRRDPVFASADGRPMHVEWSFGEKAGRPVVLELEDGFTVSFRGRLDRVDVTASGARVIDYKSGGGGTERNRLKEGLSVQLPVYMLAVRQTADADYPAVSCLYRLVTRRGGFEDLPLARDEQEAEARLRRLVGGAVRLVDDGLFPRTTRQRCEYCDVSYACGTAAWVRARKREAAALAPVVALQAPEHKGDGDGS
jgi:ATP-dependent helicase/nuclease subunit B